MVKDCFLHPRIDRIRFFLHPAYISFPFLHHDVSTAAPVRVLWSYVPLRSDDVRRVCGAGRGAQGQLFYQSTVEILLDC